jgi:hypothetical protein
MGYAQDQMNARKLRTRREGFSDAFLVARDDDEWAMRTS